MRRLLLLISVVMLVDTSFYAAITPLLPYYVDQEHLTKTSAGILVGVYAAGGMLAALPSGWLGARIGSRALLAGGLALLAVTSVTFGLAHSIVLLDLARFAQGVGGALTWTGGIGWLSATAPPDRRGAMMGTAMAAATGGALLGPVLGAIARGIGTDVTFGAVGAIAAVLLAVVLAFPAQAVRVGGPSGSLRQAIRQGAVARGLWLASCAALLFGTVNLLLPLRIDAAGGSAALIAVLWVVAAGLEALVNPLSGRYADRHGWVGIARFALVAGAGVVVLGGLTTGLGPLAAVVILSGPAIGLLWTPGLIALGEGSDAAGYEHTYAIALWNLAWAGAQTVATAGGGALAHASSDIVPLALVAAVAVVTAATMLRGRAYVREA